MMVRKMKLIDLDTEKEYLLDGKYNVEPIVHCKDCKYAIAIVPEASVVLCNNVDCATTWGIDSYCSNGRRKEESDGE